MAKSNKITNMPLDLTPKQPPYYNIDQNLPPNPGTPPKQWIALLTQAGTDPPTAVILKNTFTGTITLSYETTGSYFIDNTQEEFTENKTTIEWGATTTINTGLVTLPGAIWIAPNQLNIVTYLANDTPDTITRQNDRLLTTPITISTYQ